MAIFEQLNIGAFYFLLVRAVVLVVEVFYLITKKGRESDVLPNILCGALVYFCFKLGQSAVVLAMMYWVAGFAYSTLEFSWWLLLLTILGVDLGFYVYHRSSHTLRFFWADHSVHHSSKEFDFTTNLRASFFSSLYSWWPTIPLLLIGISPLLVMWCRALVNDYTFFLHTQYVKKLGWLEGVMNTPSHHRVHHSRNPEYINKNFGFMFIFWDKLFGTYAEENAPCLFGLNDGPKSKNPIKFVFFEWQKLAALILNARGWRNKIRVLGRMQNPL